jgi:hypothetical protein
MLNDPYKVAAIAVAAGLFLWPYLPGVWKAIKESLPSLPRLPEAKKGISTDDLTMILDLARRLKADGNDKAAKQAKMLLDAMLDPAGVTK